MHSNEWAIFIQQKANELAEDLSKHNFYSSTDSKI